MNITLRVSISENSLACNTDIRCRQVDQERDALHHPAEQHAADGYSVLVDGDSGLHLRHARQPLPHRCSNTPLSTGKDDIFIYLSILLFFFLRYTTPDNPFLTGAKLPLSGLGRMLCCSVLLLLEKTAKGVL